MFDEIIFTILGFILGLLISLQVFVDNPEFEKDCYNYYLNNNGYVLDSCERYSDKWRDF